MLFLLGKVRFFGYIIFYKGIQIEDEWIKVVYDWLKS